MSDAKWRCRCCTSKIISAPPAAVGAIYPEGGRPQGTDQACPRQPTPKFGFFLGLVEAYWSSFTAAPARAAGAAAAHTARREKGAVAAVAKATAKAARISGSANEQLDDGSKELTARVEFSSGKFQVSSRQPAAVNGDLEGRMMAKLMIDREGDTRTEKWEVGRIKSAKTISAALPQGGAPPRQAYKQNLPTDSHMEPGMRETQNH